MPIPGLAPPGHALRIESLIDVIGAYGLTTNLKLCLDAGDASSYTSGQSWLDRSGNGYDFYRGSGSGSDSADPTFNGTPDGLSANEYWSYDGGDYHTYDSANEAWMTNIHKNNALFTLLLWVNLASVSGYQSFAGTRGTLIGHTGFAFSTNGNKAYFTVENGGSVVALWNSTGTLSAGAWEFVAISYDEAAGAGSFAINGATEAISGAYSSPASGAASNTMCIASTGGGNEPIPSGNKIAMVAAWEGVALTAAQLTAIYQATRGRFGV